MLYGGLKKSARAVERRGPGGRLGISRLPTVYKGLGTMSTFHCPVCGAELEVSHYEVPDMRSVNSGGPYEEPRRLRARPPAPPHGWRMRGAMSDGASFRVPKNDMTAGLPPFQSAYRSTPVRPPEHTDWTVPLMQAIVTGLLVGLPAGWGVAWLIRRAFDVEPVTVVWMGLFFIGSIMLVWLWRLGAYSDLLMKVEEVTGVDLSGDGQVGPPKPPGVDVSVKHEAPGHERYEFDTLPVSSRRGYAGLISYARAITQMGESFAERPANECGGYSRAEWIELRDKFLNHGWARWVNEQAPQQGVELTAYGMSILRRIAGEGMPRSE
jgi:hypothetical protein